jgi:hypothetical protein
MAFAFFGRRRRDGQPPAPDEVLAADAARATALPNPLQLVPDYPAHGAPYDLEASMPRWRRPSLLAARKADPLRSVVTDAPRLAFSSGLVGPLDGHERRLIRYRLVRLLESPDELRAAEIGSLDQGDEVQLLRRSGTYWEVLCPDGRQGWVHKMTLGDVVAADGERGDDDEESGSPAAGRDVDDDVLSAYIAARSRT